jgi:hypothetical protein
MSDTLTGLSLDAEVARVLGYTNVRESQLQPGRLAGRGPDGMTGTFPAYSAADCSGLAPVLAWLTENAPTAEQVDAMGMTRDGPPYFQCARRTDGQWWAEYTAVVHYEGPQSVIESELSATLPEAACRLLVAWAAKRPAG